MSSAAHNVKTALCTDHGRSIPAAAVTFRWRRNTKSLCVLRFRCTLKPRWSKFPEPVCLVIIWWFWHIKPQVLVLDRGCFLTAFKKCHSSPVIDLTIVLWAAAQHLLPTKNVYIKVNNLNVILQSLTLRCDLCKIWLGQRNCTERCSVPKLTLFGNAWLDSGAKVCALRTFLCSEIYYRAIICWIFM